MASRRVVSVSVTPEQEAFLRERVSSGRFSSVSEVVRAGLRLLECSEAASDHKMQRPVPVVATKRGGKALNR